MNTTALPNGYIITNDFAQLAITTWGLYSICVFSGLFWLSTAIVISLLSHVCSMKYGRLVWINRCLWDAYCTRFLYAILVVPFSFKTFVLESYIRSDMLDGKTPVVIFFNCVTVGFNGFDALWLTFAELIGLCFAQRTKNYRVHFVPLLHHWIIFPCSIWPLYYDRGYGIFVFLVFLEVSSPFTTVSWVASKLGMLNTNLWRVNQLLLIHVFHLRSFLECSLMALATYHIGTLQDEAPNFVCLCILLICLTAFLVFVTPYYTYLHTSKFFRELKADHPRSKKD